MSTPYTPPPSAPASAPPSSPVSNAPPSQPSAPAGNDSIPQLTPNTLDTVLGLFNQAQTAQPSAPNSLPSQQPPTTQTVPGTASPGTPPVGGQEAQPPQLDPNAQPPASAANMPDWVVEYGGEQYVKNSLGFSDLFLGPQPDIGKALDFLDEKAPQRYDQIVDNVWQNHPDYLINQILKNNPDKVLAALKWDPAHYEQYKQFVESGGQLQQQPPSPEAQQLRQLQEWKAQKEAAERNEIRSEKFQQFHQGVLHPLIEAAQKLQLPNDDMGNRMTRMLIGAAHAALETHPKWQESRGYFDKFEYDLAGRNELPLRTAVETAVREAVDMINEHRRLQAENQQLRQQMGATFVNPGLQAPAMGANPGQYGAPQQQGNYSSFVNPQDPLNTDDMRREFQARIAQRR